MLFALVWPISLFRTNIQWFFKSNHQIYIILFYILRLSLRKHQEQTAFNKIISIFIIANYFIVFYYIQLFIIGQ